jgi:hypothetical protein
MQNRLKPMLVLNEDIHLGHYVAIGGILEVLYRWAFAE